MAPHDPQTTDPLPYLFASGGPPVTPAVLFRLADEGYLYAGRSRLAATGDTHSSERRGLKQQEQQGQEQDEFLSKYEVGYFWQVACRLAVTCRQVQSCARAYG